MSKGEATRERILDHAFRRATRDGLGGISIGVLADDVGLSKSGLFAHFGSKEDLQIEVLRRAAERFAEVVLKPAFKSPRGEPRLRKLFKNWLAWVVDPHMPGGCLFVTASVEMDDREGPVRDVVAARQKQLLGTVAKAAGMAVEEGHFRADLDAELFAFEMMGILLAYNHAKRLLREPKADARAKAAFERLLEGARA